MAEQTIPGVISDGIKGAQRIGFTTQVLALTGLNWLRGRRSPTPRLLRQTFEKLGTTYIKLGQFIASSPALFPEEYVLEFQDCLDNTPSIPYARVRMVIESDLGRPVHEVYTRIDPIPLASASIAQVHAATLVTGEDVVIKVQKPGVHNILLTDLNFLYLSASLLEWAIPDLSMASLADIVSELKRGMLEECDFIKETHNMEEFREFLKQTGIEDVTLPKVYVEASSSKVLTMERFYGVPFTDLDAIEKVSANPQYSLISAMNAWFASLALAKSFHADVHAGNLMVLNDGRVGFIDFGIVGRISTNTRESLSDFVQAITSQDYPLMAKAMVGIGITSGEIDTEQLGAEIEALYNDMTGNMDVVTDMTMMGGGGEELNKLMIDILNVGKRYGIHFPREFTLLLKQILYFDRYIQLLSPNQNIYNDERMSIMPDMNLLPGHNEKLN